MYPEAGTTDSKQEGKPLPSSLETDTESHSSEQLLERVNWLFEAVTGAVNRGESRAEVKLGVCEGICGADFYDLAWTGEKNRVTDDLVVGEWAGADRFPDDASIPLQSDDPSARAAETTEIQTVADVSTLPAGSLHREVCGDQSGAVAAIPLVNNDAFYCVLHVYVAETHVFDDPETAVLRALGTTISTAIHIREIRQSLTADRVTKLEFDVAGADAFFVDISATLDSRMEYHSSIQQRDGTTAVFFDVSGTSPSDVLASAGDHPDVRMATHLTDYGDAARFKFVVADPPMVSVLADFGGKIKELTVDDGQTHIRVEFPSTVDVRQVTDRFEDVYSRVELLAYREAERPGRTRRDYEAELFNRLTDRQTTALRRAHASGFYEWPRGTSGDTLAESMDIVRSTYHQHLRSAEKKLVEAFLEK